MTSAGRTSTGVALLTAVGLLGGCGGSAGDGSGDTAGAPPVTVRAGGEAIHADATQYCLDGEGARYQTEPPIVEVLPDTTVELSVPTAVARAGWSVQVFDEKLEEKIGDVEVPEGQATFDQISTSDVVPPTFYLVVVEDSDPEQCSGLSGAWPIGFIRTDGTLDTTSPTPSPAG